MLVVHEHRRRGVRYPVRIDVDERGWAGHVRLAGDQVLAVRTRHLQDLDEALVATFADLAGSDTTSLSVHPTGVPPPRPLPRGPLDDRAAERLLVALLDAAG
jgi:hypothetical protein